MGMRSFAKWIIANGLLFLGSGLAFAQANDVCTKPQGDRTLVIDMKAGQRYLLNMDSYTAQRMPGVLAKVMANRSERVVFLVVRRQVGYVELQKFEDTLFKAIPGIKIGLIQDDDQTCVPGQPSGTAAALPVLVLPR
jgi:biopolymer transport protein ExbD